MVRKKLGPKIAETIDFNSLHKFPDTFLSSTFRSARLVDSLWGAKSKLSDKTIFLFHFEGEGKSTEYFIYRAFEYQAVLAKEWWLSGHGKCPTIIPITFYYGKGEWKHGRRLSDIFENPEEWIQLVFKGDMITNLNFKDLEELAGIGKSSPTYISLAKQSEGNMAEIIEHIHKALREGRECCRDRIYAYILDCGGKKEQEAILEKIRNFDADEFKKIGNMMERIRKEAIREGKKEGIQEGRQEERKMLKKRLLELGISPEILKKAYSTASKT